MSIDGIEIICKSSKKKKRVKGLGWGYDKLDVVFSSTNHWNRNAGDIPKHYSLTINTSLPSSILSLCSPCFAFAFAFASSFLLPPLTLTAVFLSLQILLSHSLSSLTAVFCVFKSLFTDHGSLGRKLLRSLVGSHLSIRSWSACIWNLEFSRLLSSFVIRSRKKTTVCRENKPT